MGSMMISTRSLEDSCDIDVVLPVAMTSERRTFASPTSASRIPVIATYVYIVVIMRFFS